MIFDILDLNTLQKLKKKVFKKPGRYFDQYVCIHSEVFYFVNVHPKSASCCSLSTVLSKPDTNTYILLLRHQSLCHLTLFQQIINDRKPTVHIPRQKTYLDQFSVHTPLQEQGRTKYMFCILSNRSRNAFLQQYSSFKHSSGVAIRVQKIVLWAQTLSNCYYSAKLQAYL